ncbi:hypothetical protein BDZ94DRAFT_433532 [Collybia nuda]|uniref:Hemerythrin-like domain-containing protein n=1 Tax=Collybia nuda TaxID=64659 RepID=A0A9P6CLM7_9AGAR|nr:hypothetical protein BDZ94DRAFT_433532 [Collybia nuda]
MATVKVTYASAEEERRWNHLSNLMNSFHQWFKDEFKRIYESADGSFANRGLSLSQYLSTVTSFNASLTMHHTMEERHVFPILAQGIPKFASSTHGGHIDSHREIHDGLENLAQKVTKWTEDPTMYSPMEMKISLEALSNVLFSHLDQEVEDIRGDNLKPYFTLDVIESIGKGV